MAVVITAGFPDIQADMYEKYGNSHTYTNVSGMLVIPVMGAIGTPPKVVRVCAPYGMRHVETRAQKRQNPPLFPAVGVNTPSGDTFLSGVVSIAAVPGGDNMSNYDYVCNTSYDYVQGVQPSGSAVRGQADQFQTGRWPFASDSFNASLLIAQSRGGVQPFLDDDDNSVSTSTLSNVPQPPEPVIAVPDNVWVSPDPSSNLSAGTTVDPTDYVRLYFDSTISASLQSTNLIT